MIDQDSLPTGSLEEVQQDEELPFAHPPIPVQVEGVVPVHTTGSRHGVSFNRQCTSAAGAIKILSENPRRRIVRLLSDQAFYINTSEAGLVTGSAANWLQNVPLELTHTEELWVYMPIDGTLNVLTEDWAD